PRDFDGEGLLAELQRWERADELRGYVSFPSFHVAWAWLAAWVYAERWPRWKWLAWLIAGAMSVSCVTTGMHSLVDVPAGLALFGLALAVPELWSWLLRVTERVANSWYTVRLGP